MLNQKRFREQMELLSTYFMREFPVELLEEYWDRFKDKEQGAWDKAVDTVMSEEKYFPVEAVLQEYYEIHLPSRKKEEFPSMKDLEEAVKEGKHKHYLRLIKGLLHGKIKTDDSRVIRCLGQQGNHPTYKRYNSEKRCFEKL